MKKLTWRYLAACSTVVAAAVLSQSAWAAVPSFADAPAIHGDSNFCIGKDDGTYAHPDCRVRYACARNSASEIPCPTGEVFDKLKNRDDDPSLSYCSAPAVATYADCSGLALKK